MSQQNHLDALAQRSLRDRVGICIEGTDPVDTLNKIRAAELAGVQQIWMTAGGAGDGSPIR
jgi:hypothetical protein